MATTFKWVAPETIVTYASTSMNSLADGAFAGAGSVISNESGAGLYQYIDLEVSLGPVSPAAGAFLDVWIYPSMDGTTFASPSKPLITTNLLATFQADTTASTSQRMTLANIPIPPLDFQLDIRNKTGVQLSGIGTAANTLKYRRHYEQGV